METKKPTTAQLLRRIERAVVHIDLTKSTISTYFSDKGVRLTANDESAVIAFGYSQTIFNSFTSSGVSRPWLYTKRVIEIANENKESIKTDSGYSFQKLLKVLKEKEDNAEYNIVVFLEWWLFNCFQPLFSIAETETDSFLVYEDYVHNIARNAVILEEKKEDMTDKQFIDKVIKNMQEYTGHNEPRVIFHKKTDEERVQEEIAAMQEQELNETMEGKE